VTPFNKEMHERAPSSNKYYSDFETKELSFYQNIQFFEKKKKKRKKKKKKKKRKKKKKKEKKKVEEKIEVIEIKDLDIKEVEE